MSKHPPPALMRVGTSPRKSLIWHESTYLPPSIAYELFNSSKSTNNDEELCSAPLSDIITFDGISDVGPRAAPDYSIAHAPDPTQVWPPGHSVWNPCNIDSAKSDESIQECRIGVPDGGLRAWFVVAGGFIIFTISLGLLNSFGLFQATLDRSWSKGRSDDISLIGNTQLFILFVGGLVVGPLFDKWGARLPMSLGTLFCFISFLSASYCTQLWQFIVTQGVFFGTGIALLYYPATSAISEWFNEKRALALGIAISGSSVGGIFWPILISKCAGKLGSENMLRTIAAIATPFLILGCLLVRERKGVAGHDTSGNQADPPQRSIRRVIMDWRFFALSISLFILYSGLLIPFNFIPLYAMENGISPELSNTFLAITYSGSFFSRIGAGLLAGYFGRFNVLSLMGCLVAIVTFSWVEMRTEASMKVFCVLFGLFSGGLVPLSSACIAQTTPDMGHIGLRIGVMMAICSIGALGSGPLSIVILNNTRSWAGALAFGGSMSLLGAISIFTARFLWVSHWFDKF